MNAAAKSTDWFGQPRGLTFLFMTEMWEKFSFYGMRALLVYYMTKQLLFSGSKASLIYGLYTGLVYLTPIFGGYISDRWLGRRRAVIIGGSIMALGHFLMAFPPLLFPALGCIALGNGFYLPNLPSQIDQLYARDDPRRGSAFNIYYVGVNLGAFLAPLICGTLGERYGWHLGFGAAGIGMCLGLVIYMLGGKWLPVQGPVKRVVMTNQIVEPAVKGRLTLFAAIIVAVLLFRGAYEQFGNTIALWIDSDVNRMVGDFLVPGSWFQSLNPLIVFLFTPVLIVLWTRAATRGREPSPLRKCAMGALGVSASYLALAGAALLSHSAGIKAPMLVLLAFIAVYTISELYILPVGLGLFGRLAGAKFQATVIAWWFFAAFVGNFLAGYLGSFYSHMRHEAFFAAMAGVPAMAAVILWSLDGRARAVEAASEAAQRDAASAT